MRIGGGVDRHVVDGTTLCDEKDVGLSCWQRLNQLQNAGVYYRSPIEDGRSYEYLLTEAGKELESIVMDLAVWGQRWSRHLRKEIVGDHIMVEGKMEFRRALPDWLCGSTPGAFERSHPGPERDLY